ncbi:dicarboxylate/amino acid:cation symporter [Spiroplasma turonicum]|uniref:L-cystine uptake protein TcyP n=1 Tax=Spiroplasma turonicum TaxID=216946 RepID=A0A0K1P6E1_9MOLU|nr:dicarboxylate/amino acid:cation symporter [Spiroplasma turonicum]AKU79769.1 proton/glutamate symporter [Spiroplasma turonicum]ALX70787.1 proton/glutamate symporter [Spiroplasma turonicum]
MLYTDILKDFLAISSWKSLLAILIFFSLQISLWFFLKKFKNKFLHLFSGLVLGLLFGLVIQIIAGFPESFTEKASNESEVWKKELYWIYELDSWAVLFKKIFILSITLLMIPLIFLSIYRAITKKSSKRLGRITGKGISFLMINVAIAFCIAAGIGILLKIGVTSDGKKVLDEIGGQGSNNSDSTDIKSIPNMIIDYLPKNFISDLGKDAVIPVLIMALIVGLAVKAISIKNEKKVESFVKLMDASWEIVLKIVNSFIKIIPLAIMSIVTNLMITQSLTALTAVGKVLGAGYLSLFICVIYLTCILAIVKINPSKWWKNGWRPAYQGLVTQSSSATLPFTMNALVDKMKVDESCVNTIIPLSTTMGMIGGAGAEGGLIVALLWTGSDSNIIHDQGIWLFLLLGLIMTMIISLGVPGTPGTSTLVITSLLGSLGVPSFKNAAFSIMLVLEDIYDIGRTAVNIIAAMVVSTIVGFSEGMIGEDSEILSKKAILYQSKINETRILKDEKSTNIKTLKLKILSKDLDENIKLSKKQYEMELKKIKSKYQQSIKDLKSKTKD